MKNMDNKCFYIVILENLEMLLLIIYLEFAKKDLEIVKEVVDECDIDFENVSLNEMNEIEKLLEVDIHVFSCDKKFNSKKIIRKSKSDFDKDLDLLLIDNIKHYVLIKDLNKSIGDNSHAIKTCRNCLNVFYSENKYKEHVKYCQNRKPKKLMPSYKNICNLKI